MNGAPDTIETLVRDLRPVRRLAPPFVRATLWLSFIVVLAASAGLALGQPASLWRRLASPPFAVEIAATLLTGIAAVLAAFHVSLPDRSRAWALLPAVPLAVWLAASGSQCWHALSSGVGWDQGAEPGCFIFIAGAGIPVTLSLLYVLRRAAPLEPVRTALLAALGAAALCAAALQFFHPFDVTFLDLGFHLAAVGLLLAFAAFLARIRRLRGPI